MGRVAEIGCIVCKNKGLYSPSKYITPKAKQKKGAHLKVLPFVLSITEWVVEKNPLSRHPYKKRFEQAYGTEKEKIIKTSG